MRFLTRSFRQHCSKAFTAMLLASAASFAAPAAADGVADFYKGRTVTLVVGSSTGGGYDLNARLLSQHIGKYIPGHPTVIVQNVPGAGGLKAAGYMYSIAPKDGSSFSIMQRNLAVEPLFTNQPYDGSKFTWIGSVSNDVSLCIASKDSKVKKIEDLKTEPFIVAGQAAGSDSYVFASILKNMYDAKVKIISGYPGGNEMGIAVERGEVDGMCGLSYSSLKGRLAHLLKQKLVNILVQASVEKDPTLPDVPTLVEMAKTDEERSVLKLLVGTQRMARPFMAPPGIPDDRKAALRAAFDKTMKDPAFVADAAKQDIEVTPMVGGEIDQLLAELYSYPKTVVTKAAWAMSN